MYWKLGARLPFRECRCEASLAVSHSLVGVLLLGKNGELITGSYPWQGMGVLSPLEKRLVVGFCSDMRTLLCGSKRSFDDGYSLAGGTCDGVLHVKWYGEKSALEFTL